MKRILLQMMDEFHSFCDNNDLRYYLTSGSLIGAIRHNGYIPWDDDIDVVMPRSDYDKAIGLFNQKYAYSEIKIFNENDDPEYYLPYAKLVNLKTELIENVDANETIGVYIDIFPLDNMSNDLALAKKFFRKVGIERNKLILKTVSIRKGRAWYKNLGLKIAKIYLRKQSANLLARSISKMAVQYRDSKFTKYVCVVTVATYGEKEILECECYENRFLHEFEGRKYYVPSGYHKILSNLYGDYMQLPPVEKQVTHHLYKAYWRE